MIRPFFCLLPAILLLSAAQVQSAAIVGGSVTMTLEEGHGTGIGFFDAYFGDDDLRSELISSPSPGTVPFERLSGAPGTPGSAGVLGVPGIPGVVRVVDPIRPGGEGVPPGVPGDSRTKQATTLDVNLTDVLGNWGASTDGYAFVSGGDQIAFTSMQRWGGPFTGVLVYGDFALRYVPPGSGLFNSGLVLTSNLDFPNAVFATIGDPNIEIIGNELHISGDLLIGLGLNVLDPTSIPGTKFGTFNMVAYLEAPVPEPGTLGLLALGGAGGVGLLLQRRRIGLALDRESEQG